MSVPQTQNIGYSQDPADEDRKKTEVAVAFVCLSVCLYSAGLLTYVAARSI
jgi:hypothetical protein